MLVTDGKVVYETSKMIEIDYEIKENGYDKCERSILFDFKSKKYFYWDYCNYNLPHNVSFIETKVNSLKEIDEDGKPELEKDIYDADFDIIYTTKECLLDNAEEDIIEDLGEECFNELKKLEVFNENEINKIIAKYNVDDGQYSYFDDEDFKNLNVSNIYDNSSNLLVELYDGMSGNWRLNVVEVNNSYLIYSKNIESAFICESKVFPSFILEFMYQEQQFNLFNIFFNIPKSILHYSTNELSKSLLHDKDIASIWGITKQNYSSTYANPKESQARVRKRQKLIIELGTAALFHGLKESDIIQNT